MQNDKEKKEKERKELIRVMTQNVVNNYKAAPKIEVSRTYEFKKEEKSK